MTMFRRILVPTDGTEAATRGLRTALDLAQPVGAELVVLTAVAVPHAMVVAVNLGQGTVEAYVERVGKEALKPAVQVLADAGIGAEVEIVVGPAAEVITMEAERLQADLVVMGRRSWEEITGVFLGGIPERVARRLRVPLLLVP